MSDASVAAGPANVGVLVWWLFGVANLQWDKIGAEVVIESTGLFLDKTTAEKHLAARAKQVILSAPSKDDTAMFVYGVNHGK